jgi:manganese transport protein
MVDNTLHTSISAPPAHPETGWRQKRSAPSLAEVHASIPVPKNAGFWKTLLAFVGPGLLVSVGYMDPGNWATDLAGGAQFG